MTGSRRSSGDPAHDVSRHAAQATAQVAAARAERVRLLLRVAPFFVLFYGFVPFQVYVLTLGQGWSEMGWGLPLTVAGAALFTVGFCTRLRRVNHVLAGGEAQAGGWGLIALALVCTLVGFTGPFWANGAAAG